MATAAIPDSKVYGANMVPTWDLSVPDGPHVGPMNLATRVSIDMVILKYSSLCTRSVQHSKINILIASLFLGMDCYLIIINMGYRQKETHIARILHILFETPKSHGLIFVQPIMIPRCKIQFPRLFHSLISLHSSNGSHQPCCSLPGPQPTWKTFWTISLNGNKNFGFQFLYIHIRISLAWTQFPQTWMKYRHRDSVFSNRPHVWTMKQSTSS